jgi:hypothetical protein
MIAAKTEFERDESPKSRPSRVFLDLREVTRTTIAVRVQPQHAKQVWELLHLRDPSIRPLAKTVRRATEYLTKEDGSPFLDGDWDYVELRTHGTLEVVTRQLTSFFMSVAETIYGGHE